MLYEVYQVSMGRKWGRVPQSERDRQTERGERDRRGIREEGLYGGSVLEYSI